MDVCLPLCLNMSQCSNGPRSFGRRMSRRGFLRTIQAVWILKTQMITIWTTLTVGCSRPKSFCATTEALVLFLPHLSEMRLNVAPVRLTKRNGLVKCHSSAVFFHLLKLLVNVHDTLVFTAAADAGVDCSDQVAWSSYMKTTAVSFLK